MLSHELFLYIVFLLLPLTTQVKTSQETSQNAVKRFTLQDLLSSSDQSAAAPPVQQDASKTQTVDINSLLAAAQRASTAQQTSQFSSSNKPIDIDVAPDKNGNINLDDLPGLVKNAMTGSSANNNQDISMTNLQSLLSAKAGQMVAPPTGNKVVKEELNLGKEKIELEAAGKRATRYALAKGPDGGLNLVPVVEGAQQTDGNKFQVLQPKGYEEKGSSRQQMQLTTLSQAMYSPFPSDQNTLHLHLKGKDGKDGKPGSKGPMGPLGPKGPEGPHGPKGDAGTCSSQINGLFECTPDELDSLSNRVDYLEKICHKVESGAKKHKIRANLTKSSKEESKDSDEVEHKEVNAKEKVKESITPEEKKDDKQNASVEKDQTVKENAKNTDEKIDTTGDKKNFKGTFETNSQKTQPRSDFRDPVTAALKSMIDVRAKLKISELDILDRIKQAKEGVMKTL